MEFIKTLVDVRKDLKKRIAKVANERENQDLPNGTLKSVLNEALEIGLQYLEDSKKSKNDLVLS